MSAYTGKTVQMESKAHDLHQLIAEFIKDRREWDELRRAYEEDLRALTLLLVPLAPVPLLLLVPVPLVLVVPSST